MKLRVCYFGTYRAEYSRNQITIEGLRRAGAEVIECHAQLWTGVEDRVQVASGGWISPDFLARLLQAYSRLLAAHRQIGPYDVMVLGYPGALDVFLAKLLTRLRGCPLVWDIFMSVYLIALERGLQTKSVPSVTALRLLERLACRLPDRLILDTEAYRRWFCETHAVDESRFRLVPTGADDRVFPRLEPRPPNAECLTLVYYGTFIPNHGVPIIVEAARLLPGDPAARFVLIGEGPDKPRALQLVEQYGLKNVEFVDWAPPARLVEYVSRADVCLGAFGATPQSLMTIQNKIYEALAMGRPVLTGDSPTVRAAFEHGRHVYLCERGNPRALAEAVLALQRDSGLRARLAQAGYARFRAGYDPLHVGQAFLNHLLEVVLAEGHGRKRTALD